MNKAVKIFSSIVLALSFVSGLAFAQTAALLPPAVSQFFDNNGNPLSAGTVTTYVVGSTTLKTTWTNSGETIANTNPIVLDAAGRAIIYGDGAYRQVVKDRNGNIIWDAVTSAFGSGGATLVGDGTAVGTVLPWSGVTAPTRYAFAYGQELSRTTYSSLYSAITLNVALSCTISSNILTGLSDTTQIPIGAPVEASCVASGTTVTAKTGSTVTVSNNATVTISVNARFFPWGNGNGTTTFSVPDLRGRVLPGRDNMGGTAAARLTTAIYGAANPDSIGAAGGAQSVALGTTNLPAYTPAGTIAAHQHFIANSLEGGSASPAGTLTSSSYLARSNNSGGNSFNYTLLGDAPAGVPTIGLTSSATTVFTGTAQGGVATPFAIIQPSITINYIIKLLPDTSISTLNVVTSLGGMIGDITCSGVVVCSGQDISVAGAGSGDVIGPAASTNGNIAVFDGITGKLLTNASTGIDVPNNVFGGSWVTHYSSATVDNASHAFNAQIAFSASTLAAGSTVDGPATANYAGFFQATKQNYLTSVISGEIDGVFVTTFQGKFGDTAAILAGAQKTNGGTGAALGAEISAELANSSGVAQQTTHGIVGLMSVDTSEYVGFNTEAWEGTLTSAFRADTYTGVGTPVWSNVLIARTNRTDANIYFKIDGAGKVFANDGTGAVPSYSFVTSATDGMWHPGAGSIGWATAAVNRLTLDSTHLFPGADNTYALGASGAKWTTVYATNFSAATYVAIGGCTIGSDSLCASGPVSLGAGTGSYGFSINGGNSGASDAAFVALKNAGTTNLYLGNLSGITGGGYSTEMAMYLVSSGFHLYTNGVEHLTVSTAGLTTLTGALTVTALPTSAGGGGLYVCIDTAGVMYKKAGSCP